jgi:predicted metal-binding membrane protein
VTTATTDRVLEAALKRDRWVVIAGVVGIAGLAWLYLLRLGASMAEMASMPGMTMTPSWGAGDFVVAFVMWAVMMVAMMLPSVAPVLVLFAGLNRRRREQWQPAISTAFFLAGYLVVWAAFSVLASLAQGVLHSASLLSPALAATSAVISGGLLVLAGIYQWTPLKSACLAACRSPLGFLMAHWRDGIRGAIAMGLRHGVYCVGCCWLLMALLFAAGVMNLLWVAVIAVFVLVEKVGPAGPWVGRLAGLALVVTGVVVMRAG